MRIVIAKIVSSIFTNDKCLLLVIIYYDKTKLSIITIIVEFRVMNQTELRENLSRNIKQRRKLYSLTQEKLAEEAGLSAQTINDIEGGRTWVSDKTLVKLAEVLRVSPAELLVRNDTENSDSIDFLRFKSDLQDSVRQTIEEMFEKKYK